MEGKCTNLRQHKILSEFEFFKKKKVTATSVNLCRFFPRERQHGTAEDLEEKDPDSSLSFATG